MKLFTLIASLVALSSAWEMKWQFQSGDEAVELTEEEEQARQMAKEQFFHRMRFAEGFVYGFAVYDNLSETAKCMKEGYTVFKDVRSIREEYALGEIGSSEVMFKVFNAIKAVPAQWKECFEAPTDLLKFDDWFLKITSLKMEDIWAAMFTVKADFELGMSDLAQGYFFKAGKDFAKIFVDLVNGPEPDVLPETNSNMAIGNKTEVAAELMAGIIYGITEKNDLEQIETCMQDGDEFVSDILLGIHMLEKMDFVDLINGMDLLAATVGEIPNYLYQCSQMGDDLKEFEEWLSVFEHPKELAPVIEHNIKVHLAGLTLDLAKVRKDIANEEWFAAGEEIGIMLTIAIGPVQYEMEYDFESWEM